MMKYLANENLPGKTIAELQNDGIDILSVKEIIPGAVDDQVLLLSIEEKRILVTFDKDFGELVFKQRAKKPLGIILLRFVPKSADYVTSYLKTILSKNDIPFLGHFTIVSEDKIRTVPLP